MATNTAPQAYRALDADKYSELQRDLLKVKGGELQRAFLQTLKDNSEFTAFIENRCPTTEGDNLPTFGGALTEASFKDMPQDQEKRVYELWRDVPPRTASQASFWASVTLEHIREDKIAEATWLAANGNINESGEERIDHALAKSNSDADNRAIDNCVRTALRRMSGLPIARGNRSVFVNPPFGRAYWRERIVQNILDRNDATADRSALLDVVRRSQQYWENLVMLVVSRGSVFGSEDVQAALINTLAIHFQRNPNTPLQTATQVSTIGRRISNIAASRELGALPFPEICDIIADLLKRLENAYLISAGNSASSALS